MGIQSNPSTTDRIPDAAPVYLYSEEDQLGWVGPSHLHNLLSYRVLISPRSSGLSTCARQRSATFVCLFDITQTNRLLSESQKGTAEKEKKLLRPYQEESTTSRLISEVKPLRAWLVLGLETTWEHQVS